MSLILRRESQELLNSNLLGDYHIDIDSNYNMAVVSTCGKPLFTIKGVTFAKRNPTLAEIEYAVSLLRDFLAMHNQDIKKYFVTLPIGQSAQNKLDTLAKKYKTGYSPLTHRAITTFNGVTFECAYDNDEYTYAYGVSTCNRVFITKKQYTKVEKELIDVIKQATLLKTDITKMNEALKKLVACDI